MQLHFRTCGDKKIFLEQQESIVYGFIYYLSPADRPGTGDYKMPCVRASVCHVFTKAFLSLKIL